MFLAEVADEANVDPAMWHRVSTMFGGPDHPVRQQLMGLQLLAEIAMVFGRDAVGLEMLRTAAQRGLLDVVWLDRCPLFMALSTRQEFVEIRTQVADRAERVLAAFRSTQG